ncbi:DUF4852 domain-containing protein [Planctomycetota bacterium]
MKTKKTGNKMAVCVLLIYLSLLRATSGKPPMPLWGASFLDLSLQSIAEGRVQPLLRIVKNKPTLIIVWADWCPISYVHIKEMALLTESYRKQGLQVLVVSANNSKKDATMDVNLPFYRFTEPDRAIKTMQLDLIPVSFLLDTTGSVTWSHRGRFHPEKGTADRQRLIEALSFNPNPNDPCFLSSHTLCMTYLSTLTNYPYNDHLETYMKLFYPSILKEYRHNEFEWPGKRAEALRSFQNDVAAVDSNRFYKIPLQIKLQTYNFEQSCFPCQIVSTPLGLTEKTGIGVALNQYTDLVDKIKYTYVRIPEKLSLPLPLDRAKQLVQSHGKDRQFPAVFSFKMTGIGTTQQRLWIDTENVTLRIFVDECLRNPLGNVVMTEQGDRSTPPSWVAVR